MNTNKDKFPDIVAELKGEHSLDRAKILDYCNRFSDAWKREKDATRSRIYRLNKKSSVTNSVTQSVMQDENVTQSVTDGVTQSVTESVTNSVTQLKEERSEKENLPPTPPIREKAKKEENASPIGSAAARASVQARVREANVIPTWEMVLTRAKTTIGCNNIAWLREWFNEMNCANWCDGDGNPIHNWGRALGIAWRYKDVDAARRDPSRFQKPVDKELEEAERRKEQQKKLIQEQIAIVKAKYLAEQEAMNECR